MASRRRFARPSTNTAWTSWPCCPTIRWSRPWTPPAGPSSSSPTTVTWPWPWRPSSRPCWPSPSARRPPVLIIGENIHIIAPPVKAAIEARDAKAIQAMAIGQVEAGAGILDLNIGPQKKLGCEVMPWIVEAVQEVTDVPLSLDTTNLAAMEAGLQKCARQAMLNSASADPARLDSVMQLAAKYGARVIALTMGVHGIPTTADGRASIAMEALLPAAVVGMPCTPIVRAMTRAPYFAASCITLSRRAGSAEAELSMAWRAHFWSPASIAARLVVSSESGTSVTSCTASTIQGITSQPSFFCGPMLRSRMPAPASTCPIAMAWMAFASRASMAAFTGGAMMWMFSPMMSTGGLLALGLGQHGLDDGRHGHGQVTVVGELEDGPAGGVQGRDQRIVGQHGQEVQAVFVDGLANLRREAIGRPVDDEVVLADLGVKLRQKGGDAPRRGNATHRGVADDEQQVDVAGGAARQVLEAGLVVDHHPRVAVGDAVDDGAQHVVGGAVAAGPLGPAHGQQVDADALDDAGVDLVVQDVALGDPCLEQVGACLLAGLLADVADRFLERQVEHRVEVAGRVGVDSQDRPGLALRQAADQQPGQGRLAGAALAGDGNRGGHWVGLRLMSSPAWRPDRRRAWRAPGARWGTWSGRCAAGKAPTCTRP